MRDIRLLLVLVVSLGLIVVGGVMVPVLMNITLPPAANSQTSMVAEAADAKAPAKAPEISPTAVASADRLSEAFRDAAGRAMPSVVAITTSQTVREPANPYGGFGDDFLRRFFGFGPEQQGPGQQAPGKQRPGKQSPGKQSPGQESPPMRRFQRQGLGSGVIIDSDGYVLTNNHVVEEADEMTVHLKDGREFKGKVVGTDPATDVALVKIKADNLPVAELGDSDQMQVGDWVLAIGAPFGLEWTVTAGIISATGRHNVGITDYESFIQTDAAINPGNSGGPLCNLHGQVIGLNTAIASQSGGYMGVGFAVPIDLAKEVIKQLRETGHVTRGWLGVGIQQLAPDMAKSMNLKTDQGALVSQVFEGGPASKAGIKAGDVVLEYDGKPVKSPSELQNAVAWTKPGSKADVVVLRDGKRLTLKVTVETRAEHPEEAIAGGEAGAPTNLKDLGIEVSNITPEAIQQYGYKPGQGVLITDVDAGGLGAVAGLRPGMLILQVAGQKVTTIAEVREAVSKADLAKGVPMLVRSGDRQMFVLIKKRQ
jgi:serine protease Do